MYKDLDVLRHHRQDLVEQAQYKKDTILDEKRQKKDEELEIISQIKESLQDATRKKHNVLYKQKNVLSSQLGEQVKEKAQKDQDEKLFRKQKYEHFPFNYQDEFEQKTQNILDSRREDMQERLI